MIPSFFAGTRIALSLLMHSAKYLSKLVAAFIPVLICGCTGDIPTDGTDSSTDELRSASCTVVPTSPTIDQDFAVQVSNLRPNKQVRLLLQSASGDESFEGIADSNGNYSIQTSVSDAGNANATVLTDTRRGERAIGTCSFVVSDLDSCGDGLCADSGPVDEPDAGVDAMVSEPDAMVSEPDAMVSEPDASVVSCGNGICDGDETCSSCSTDCGTCGGFPSATNTGAKGSLTSRSAGTISNNGTVIENAMISGRITVQADNVVLRNVYIKTNDYYGILVYGKNLLIEDVTVEGGSTAGIAATSGGQFTARRVNVFGGEDGVRLADNCKLYDSYVHDLAGGADSHFDSVTADGYTGWEIVHNTILNQNSQTAAVWVGDPRYSPSEGLLENNLLAGGGYTIYAGHGTGSGIRVINNQFSTRYFPKCGSYGYLAKWESAGNTWTGNTWANGPNQGQAISP